MLKYHTFYRHRKAEEALQAMQTARMKMRVKAEGAELERARERLEHIEPAPDPLNNDSFEAETQAGQRYVQHS
jgi:septation ring formation regulator EzrA